MIAHHPNHIPCDGKEGRCKRESLFRRDTSTVQAAGIILPVPWNIGAAAVVLGRKAFSLKGCKVYSSSHCVAVLPNPVGHSYGKCSLENLVNTLCNFRIDWTANMSCVFEDNTFVLQIYSVELNLQLAVGAPFLFSSGPLPVSLVGILCAPA